MEWFAIDIGTQIKHIGGAIFLIRQNRTNRRAVDPGDGSVFTAAITAKGANGGRVDSRA